VPPVDFLGPRLSTGFQSLFHEPPCTRLILVSAVTTFSSLVKRDSDPASGTASRQRRLDPDPLFLLPPGLSFLRRSIFQSRSESAIRAELILVLVFVCVQFLPAQASLQAFISVCYFSVSYRVLISILFLSCGIKRFEFS
jgi:hypothetical protein